MNFQYYSNFLIFCDLVYDEGTKMKQSEQGDDWEDKELPFDSFGIVSSILRPLSCFSDSRMIEQTQFYFGLVLCTSTIVRRVSMQSISATKTSSYSAIYNDTKHESIFATCYLSD